MSRRSRSTSPTPAESRGGRRASPRRPRPRARPRPRRRLPRRKRSEKKSRRPRPATRPLDHAGLLGQLAGGSPIELDLREDGVTVLSYRWRADKGALYLVVRDPELRSRGRCVHVLQRPPHSLPVQAVERSHHNGPDSTLLPMKPFTRADHVEGVAEEVLRAAAGAAAA